MERATTAYDTDPAPEPHDYAAHGYAVVRGIVTPRLIDAVLERYRSDVASSPRMFLRDLHRFERNDFSPNGYVKQMFLNPHAYRRESAFAQAVREIVCAKVLHEALSRTTGFPRLDLALSMFLDRSLETDSHRDWWYTDSVPNGHLVGAWIALEDIHEQSGRFYVVRKSHLADLDERGSHPDRERVAKAYMDAHPDDVEVPALARGDVVLWNSRTLHGSLPVGDEAYSRKAITAHFLPHGYGFGSRFHAAKGVRYFRHGDVRCRDVNPDYSLPNHALRIAKHQIGRRVGLLSVLSRLDWRQRSDAPLPERASRSSR